MAKAPSQGRSKYKPSIVPNYWRAVDAVPCQNFFQGREFRSAGARSLEPGMVESDGEEDNRAAGAPPAALLGQTDVD